MQLCYRYANKKVAELFQCGPQDINGHNDYAFFDNATAKQLQHSDRQILDQGTRVVREEENTTSDGKLTRTYLSVKLPLRQPNGEIYALCGISTDITEHKQQQDVIHHERDRMLGAEVLLRWFHPEHGNYPPAEFIPVAEATGLILPHHSGTWRELGAGCDC